VNFKKAFLIFVGIFALVAGLLYGFAHGEPPCKCSWNEDHTIYGCEICAGDEGAEMWGPR
jgi:hypothetical protein